MRSLPARDASSRPLERPNTGRIADWTCPRTWQQQAETVPPELYPQGMRRLHFWARSLWQGLTWFLTAGLGWIGTVAGLLVVVGSFSLPTYLGGPAWLRVAVPLVLLVVILAEGTYRESTSEAPRVESTQQRRSTSVRGGTIANNSNFHLDSTADTAFSGTNITDRAQVDTEHHPTWIAPQGPHA